MKYIDIGLNLFCRSFPNPDRIIENTWEAGIACILTGSDMQENRRIHEYVQDHPVFGTCGIHPHGADHRQPDDMAEIKHLIESGNHRIVAVGETGLDYNRMFSSKRSQIENLMAHIELAQQLGKPMFLHERDAFDDMVSIFREHPDLPKRCVIHCFTGGRKELETYLEMGFMIGITGWICDEKRGKALRDAVSSLPLHRVMLETDAPYLTPKNVSGLDRTNVPENIRYVAATLAEHMHCEQETLEASALQNTLLFFGISPESLRMSSER